MASARRFGLDRNSSTSCAAPPSCTTSARSRCPIEMLRKHGPLSDSEWRLMRQHTIDGDDILDAAPALRAGRRIVRATHERWDGGGYPDGLAGDGDPARRAHRRRLRRLRRDGLRALLRRGAPERGGARRAARNAGTQFDPDVVEALCEHVEGHPETLRAERLDVSAAVDGPRPPSRRREGPVRIRAPASRAG